MKIRVVKSSSTSFWYAKHIGEEFNVICYYPEDSVFLVRECQGYLNIVHKDAAEIVKEQEND